MPGAELISTLRSTGAVRTFAPTPVDDRTVYDVLDDARFAPSGGNRQGWRVALVKDRSIRHRLAELMRDVWDEYAAIAATGVTPFTATAPAAYQLDPRRGVAGASTPPNPLLDHIDDVPVVLVVAADLGRVAVMDLPLERVSLAGGASVYPFCWSILLAARDRGLGGVLTTFLSRAEPAAAPVLGLPPDHALAATIFLGHPAAAPPTKLRRHPVSTFATIDRFDGAPLEPTAHEETAPR